MHMIYSEEPLSSYDGLLDDIPGQARIVGLQMAGKVGDHRAEVQGLSLMPIHQVVF